MAERLSLRSGASLPIASELAHFGDPGKAREFSAFLDSHANERHCVAMQDFPDPDAIAGAFAYRLVIEGLSIAGVGYLRHADRDAIPQATDFLQTEENVHTAIVYGILVGEGDREVIVGSLRTSKVTLDVDQFLKSALGSDARGRYFGGGRSRAGGFEIPVGFLEGTSDPDQMRLKWEAFDQQIRSRLLRAAGLADSDGDGD